MAQSDSARLVVPLDGSEFAQRAVPLAAALARADGGQLELVHALEPPLDEAAELGLRFDPFDDVEFDQQVRALAEPNQVTSFSTLAAERPSQLILKEARRPGTRAIVMATHGRSGFQRAILGSVAEQVLRAAPTPVFLVPATAKAPADPWQPKHILVPLDGSSLSEAVLPAARQLARQFDGELVLLRVYPERDDVAPDQPRNAAEPVDVRMDVASSQGASYFQPLLKQLADSGARARAQQAFGEPIAAILNAVTTSGSELIAMSTHGRSGINRLLTGSVAEGVLRRSQVPMMILGPAALSQGAEQQAQGPMRSSGIGHDE